MKKCGRWRLHGQPSRKGIGEAFDGKLLLLPPWDLRSRSWGLALWMNRMVFCDFVEKTRLVSVTSRQNITGDKA